MKVAETMAKILENLVLKTKLSIMTFADSSPSYLFYFPLFVARQFIYLFIYLFMFYELIYSKKECSLYIVFTLHVLMEFLFCRQMRFFYDGEVICEIATLQKFRHLVDLRLNGGDFNK
jgi:hypothetical protein